ncbi:MAG: NAD-dependent epimerase/dehydratase family protein [Deltaproteobacteria bacterium]|nr:NAD-dependent epimerase/dehydratase family protein [Deltaproteobacteria bacterium]
MNPKVDQLPETNPVISDDILEIVDSQLPWERFRKQRILVTGGGGFLAAYLVKALLAANIRFGLMAKVICVARGESSISRRLKDWVGEPGFEYFRHNVAEPLPADFPRADYIIHAASQASPKYYGTDPVGTLLPNALGTACLLDHARKTEAKRFLFFSSGSVYGQQPTEKACISESDYGALDPMNIRSCYGESKRIGETMCVSWAHQYGVYTSVVRPFHTYGPGVALDDGRVFADFVADVVAGRDIVMKSDGGASRAFCYISDATIAFLTVLLTGGKGEAYNVGNPSAAVSVRELAELIATLFPERGIGVQCGNHSIGNAYLRSPVMRSCPSIEKVKQLSWEPVIGVREGFRRTLLSFF